SRLAAGERTGQPPVIDCGHLILQLLRQGVAGPLVAPYPKLRQLRKLLGAQRPHHSASEPDMGVTGSAEVQQELDGATREAYSRAFGLTQPGGGVPDPAGIWGGCARAAIAAAMMMARHAGRSCARPIDLLQAVPADPPSSVRSLLEACG